MQTMGLRFTDLKGLQTEYIYRSRISATTMKVDSDRSVSGFSDFPVLNTERLTLREITLDDAEFWLRNFSDPEVVELTAFEPPKDLEAAKQEIQTYCIDLFRSDNGLRWGVELNGSSGLIGTLGYYKWVKSGGFHAQMGYDLLREFRRKGIMKEAMTAAIDYGFQHMQLNRIQIMVDPRNTPSLGLVKSLGFTKEGMLRDSQFFRGRFVDDVVFSLLRREWRRS
jgi:ribosomal-protein-alanine N-acetyltransferase